MSLLEKHTADDFARKQEIEQSLCCVECGAHAVPGVMANGHRYCWACAAKTIEAQEQSLVHFELDYDRLRAKVEAMRKAGDELQKWTTYGDDPNAEVAVTGWARAVEAWQEARNG